MKNLYILSGIPGVGKSSWSKNFAKITKNTHIISSDDIRKELGGSFQYFEEEDKVWELFLERAEQLSKENDDINVILDSTCLTDEYRTQYFGKLKNYDRYILVIFRCSFSVALSRNSRRKEGKVVPMKIMKKMYNEFKFPSKETKSKFNEVIEVNCLLD